MKKKDKKAEQIQSKRRHKEQLKANRRTGPTLDRPKPTLSEKPVILIVCEGENTEPSYFKQFRLSSATIKSVGEGENTISLVQRTGQIANQGFYEQVWCVFDKDEIPDEKFNRAISMAKENEYGVAYSNQAFEYWIILHFDDHQGGRMHRKDYDRKINKLLKPYNISYDGKNSKLITEDIFELMNGVDENTRKNRNRLAIGRAKRNLEQFSQNNPAKEESTTTVYELVEELLKYV